MDSQLFEEWAREQDQKFEREGRKVVLVVDNCPAHPEVANLKAINLVFLPPNTTKYYLQDPTYSTAWNYGTICKP